MSVDSPAVTEVLWALDIEAMIGHPHEGRPVLAHAIAATEGEGIDAVRTTVCGKRLDRWNHPHGWWGVPEGRLPLAEHAIHCRPSERGGSVVTMR